MAGYFLKESSSDSSLVEWIRAFQFVVQFATFLTDSWTVAPTMLFLVWTSTTKLNWPGGAAVENEKNRNSDNETEESNRSIRSQIHRSFIDGSQEWVLPDTIEELGKRSSAKSWFENHSSYIKPSMELQFNCEIQSLVNCCQRCVRWGSQPGGTTTLLKFCLAIVREHKYHCRIHLYQRYRVFTGRWNKK